MATKWQRNIPFMATGLVVFVNDRIGAVAGAEWKDDKCVRCAPILRKLLMRDGPKSTRYINFNWVVRLGWEFWYKPDD